MFVRSFKNSDDEHNFFWWVLHVINRKKRFWFIGSLIDNKLFFDQPVKYKQEVYEKLIETSRNNGYTALNLLDYLNQWNYYKLIGIDLSRQTITSIPQEINVTEKLEKDDGWCISLLKSSF